MRVTFHCLKCTQCDANITTGSAETRQTGIPCDLQLQSIGGVEHERHMPCIQGSTVAAEG